MRKLAIVSIAFAAAIALYMYMGGIVLPVAVGSCLILAFFVLKGEFRRIIILAALGAAAGFLWVGLYTNITYAPAAELAGTTSEIECEVIDFSDTGEYSTYVDVKIKNKDGNIKALLRLDPIYTDLEPGDKVKLIAYIFLADTMSGEETDYYKAQGIFLKVYQEGEPEIEKSERTLAKYYPKYLAKAIREKIIEVFPEDTSGFAVAILTGDRSGLEDTDYENLKASGAVHIVAVSGMHVSFLVSIIMTLVGKKKKASLICLPIIVLFMAMVGFTPSVVRAGIMQIFLILAPIFNRENDTITSISAALFIILAINPYAIMSVSLQLSFGCVFGITLFSGRLHKYIRNALPVKLKKNLILSKISGFIITNFSATVGALIFTIPLMALIFDYITVYAIITNILVLWAAFYIFIGTIVACILGFMFAPLAGIIAWIASLLIRYMLFVTSIVASLPGALLYTISPYIRIWLIASYAIFAAFILIKGERKRPILPLGLCMLIFCLSFLLTSFDTGRANMEITALNVGQGQSVVISTDNGAIMVDCGSETRNTAGERAAKFLFGKNIFKLDMLILTHFDADHVNGVTDLMSKIGVEMLVIPEPYDDSNSYVIEILKTADEMDIEICYVTKDMIFYMGASETHVYAPVSMKNSNDNGLTIISTYGDFDMLITGDMDSSIEKRLVKLKSLPDVEVMMVGHHGSKYSSSEELLDTVKAEIAIISVGENNLYGHPTEEAMERVEDSGAVIFRTDQYGNITVKAS